jgi:hypothetical protein
VLRPYPDSSAQRLLRWALLLLTVAAIVAALGGWLAWLP